MKLLLSYTMISAFFISTLSAQINVDSLHTALTDICNEGKMPGFGVAIVDQEEILFEAGFGFANKEKQQPYSTETIHNIGSVSKTFIGIALSQLSEQAKLDLNEDINKILPFKVVHPKFPDAIIRVKDLATHTSGIVDSKKYEKCYVMVENYPDKIPLKRGLKRYYKKYLKNKDMSLEDFNKAYLLPGGSLYTKKNFGKNKPGSIYEYSNIGAALAGYIVELITKKPFYEYVREEIMAPLKMNDSGLRFEDVELDNYARTYSNTGPYFPKYKLVTYPDGGVISCPHDMALYAKHALAGYQGKAGLLKPDTFKEMMKIHVAEGDQGSGAGIFWSINKKGRIGHNGADPGIFTFLMFDPKTDRGYVIMTNCDAHEDEELLNQFRKIYQTIRQ